MKYYLPFILSTIVLLFVACGGGSDTEQETETQPSDTQAAEQVDDVRTIEIIGTDQMKFVVEEEQEGITTGSSSGDYQLLKSISAEPGEEIRIRLTSESKLPAAAMAHNFVLLTMSADATAFANAAAKAKDNEYIPTDREDEVMAATDIAAGGETVEVTFTAPEESGDYEYLCSFPGHFSAGMRGTLTVE